MKRKLSDFACALLVSFGVFSCFALISGTDVFNDAFRYDEQENALYLFDVTLAVNENVTKTLGKILQFNDNVLGKNFSQMLLVVSREMLELVSDAGKLVLYAAQTAVGKI